MQYLKYALAFILGLAVITPAFAADPQWEAAKPGIGGEFTNPARRADNTPTDRLVSAIAAQLAAQSTYAKAMGERVAADAAFTPMATRLKALEDELDRLRDRADDLKIRVARAQLRTELNRAIDELRIEVGPLEAAFQKKGEAEMAAKADLEEADKELAEAGTAWQQAMMAPAHREVTDLAIKLTKTQAELATAKSTESGTAAQDLAALRKDVAENCRRNPSSVLCQKSTARAAMEQPGS